MLVDKELLKKFLISEPGVLIEEFIKELGKPYLVETFSLGDNNTHGSCHVWCELKEVPLLVAHIDTAFEPQEPKDLGGGLWQTYGRADDRAGVYTIFEIARKTYPNISIWLTSGTKRGGIGVKRICDAVKKKGLKFLYAIEYDRRGICDCIDYNGVNDPEFMKVFKEYYKPAKGTYSDVATIQLELDISAVNLSTGYENSHSLQETLFLPVIERNLELFPKISEALGDRHYPTIRNT